MKSIAAQPLSPSPVSSTRDTEPPKNCELCHGEGFMFNAICTPESCGYYADHIADELDAANRLPNGDPLGSIDLPPPACPHNMGNRFCEVCAAHKVFGEPL